MNLKELAREIQVIEHSKGHKWDWSIFDRALNLLHDEVSEASDSWRDDRKPHAVWEMVSVIVRALHYLEDCFPYEDIDSLIIDILEFNKNRPTHHSRKRNPFEK